MQSIRIVTNGVSNGARSLVDTLRSLGISCKKVNIKVSNKYPNADRFNIKWGCFEWPETIKGGVYNHAACDTTLNKLSCFDWLASHGIPVPRFTTDINVAKAWRTELGTKRIYERHKLRGSEGEGIVVKEDGAELSPAPLYVEGCYGKRREYRIHVCGNSMARRLFIQQKKRRVTGVEASTEESKIRNLANGWVFAHKEIQQPREHTIQCAVGAIDAFGLDFGAVDVIEMDKEGAFVLEINCAPGLQGATLFFYADAIKEFMIEPTESEE